MKNNGPQVRIMMEGSRGENAEVRHDYVELGELNKCLHRHAAKGHSRLARVGELTYLDGLDASEIANALNLSEQMVKTDRYRVLTELRRERAKRLRIRPFATVEQLPSQLPDSAASDENERAGTLRPPFNAEYILYLVLQKGEREEIVGDLIETYAELCDRFDKRRADLWFYKQVIGSLLPLLRRAILKVGAFVWLGRILRRLIS